MGVPTMYHRMLACPEDLTLERVRVCISGSAPLRSSDFHAFRERFGHEPLERYGLSETLIVASNPLQGERRPGSVGLPLPRTELRLASDGEILVRGPAVMSGYWRSPEIDTESFVDGYFRTGDLGSQGADGYLRISGRKKELILVGGSNVLPGEVEAPLAELPGVAELAVAGLPDPDRGELVAAFVVAAAGADTGALEAELRARAERELAPYKRPRRYCFIDELPRNALGKIDRRALRSRV
jgi:malonyl-CoA/methylmalonyl-CoA synthetase